MLRKSFSLFLAILMLLTTSTWATAVDLDKSPVDIHDMTESEIAEAALNYMQRSQNSQTITIDRIQPFVDLDGMPSAYCVSFNDNNRPAGFLLLSLLVSGDPVVELAFEGHGPNEITPVTTRASSSPLIYTGPGGFYMNTGDDSLKSLLDGNEVDIATVEEISEEYQEYLETQATQVASNGSIYDGIIDWSNGNVDMNTRYKIANFGSGTDYWLMTDFSDGSVCAPTAATNIVWYWGFQRGYTSASNPVKMWSSDSMKAKSIFNTMFLGMNTTSAFGTPDNNVPDGYDRYFENSGDWGYNTIPRTSSYSDFVSYLDDDIPIHVQVRMSTNPLSTNGHDMFTLGYASSTTGTNYLWVMTGWYTNGWLVKYDYYPVVKGYAVWAN